MHFTSFGIQQRYLCLLNFSCYYYKTQLINNTRINYTSAIEIKILLNFFVQKCYALLNQQVTPRLLDYCDIPRRNKKTHSHLLKWTMRNYNIHHMVSIEACVFAYQLKRISYTCNESRHLHNQNLKSRRYSLQPSYHDNLKLKIFSGNGIQNCLPSPYFSINTNKGGFLFNLIFFICMYVT